MLILKRRLNESIRVGDIKIMVVEVIGDVVKLGIEAPLEVQVHREEVYQAIKRNGKES